MQISRRHLLLSAASLPCQLAWGVQTNDWQKVQSAAGGQTVYFNAWAGSEVINRYIQWAAAQLAQAHGIKLVHVKISDAAEVVQRLRTERAVGRGPGQGSVDLVWINGENFAALKSEGLLFGPFANRLPNWPLVDVAGKPSVKLDFAVPTEGYESPWGMAQLTFFADSRRLPKPPQSMADLLALARANPGRITYPRPPNFHGTTFVKQALLETTANPAALLQPIAPTQATTALAGLWQYLDALHPHLWRQGRQFPQNQGAMRQMFTDGELLLAFTFNPNDAANDIAAARMPPTVQSWQFARGTLGNTHFVAIPFNAPHVAAAQVVANFLLSPQAQAHKANPAVWGDPTVLDVQRLPPAARQQFVASLLPGQVQQPAPALLEPHASWVQALEQGWAARYGS
jgi:putative thiamine transport system substrate-binding protein